MEQTAQTQTQPQTQTATLPVDIPIKDVINADSDLNRRAVLEELVKKKGLEDKKLPEVLGTLSKSYIELEKYMGSKIIPPSDADGDEAWNVFFKKILGETTDNTNRRIERLFKHLGVPAKAEEYTVDLEQYKDIAFEPESIDEFKKFAHSKKYTAQQFKDTFDFYVSTMRKMQQKYEQQRQQEYQECEKRLKEKWGSELEKRTNNVRKFVEKLGIADLLVKKGLDNSPEMVEAFDRILQMMSESVIPPTGESAAHQASDQQSRIQQITSHPAFRDPLHPEHSKILKEYISLFTKTG